MTRPCADASKRFPGSIRLMRSGAVRNSQSVAVALACEVFAHTPPLRGSRRYPPRGPVAKRSTLRTLSRAPPQTSRSPSCVAVCQPISRLISPCRPFLFSVSYQSGRRMSVWSLSCSQQTAVPYEKGSIGDSHVNQARVLGCAHCHRRRWVWLSPPLLSRCCCVAASVCPYTRRSGTARSARLCRTYMAITRSPAQLVVIVPVATIVSATSWRGSQRRRATRPTWRSPVCSRRGRLSASPPKTAVYPTTSAPKPGARPMSGCLLGGAVALSHWIAQLLLDARTACWLLLRRTAPCRRDSTKL